MSRSQERRRAEIPTKALPVLAIRDQVHFPGLINTVHVIRNWTLAAANRALSAERLLLVVSQKDMSLEEPGPEDLSELGTVSEILHSAPTPEGGLRLVLRGLGRAKLNGLRTEAGAYEAMAVPIEEKRLRRDERTEVLTREILAAFTDLAQVNSHIPAEAVEAVKHLERLSELADTVAHFLPVRTPDKQQILECFDPVDRLDKVLQLVTREQRITKLQDSIRQKVDAEVGDVQKNFYLREQLRIIQKELSEPDEQAVEIAEYEEKITSRALPDVILSKARQELGRLGRFPIGSAEAGQIRTYIDQLLEMPWEIHSPEQPDLVQAEVSLEREHFGLADVKERVLEFLAVAALKGETPGGALCFVGPPGVGKTGFARALASTLGRPYTRVALGGVRDEAEIRGHRRTYVGAMPGRIAQALRQAGSMNPVIVLDEIDKMAMEMRGDPAAALLEALDPEQNRSFRDHFLEVPIDLSRVIFVGTANSLDSMPAPLRDRMEVVPFEGYTDRERIEIARRFLIPRALAACGLSDTELLNSEALEVIVRRQIKEPGVRALDREIQRYCRKLARSKAIGRNDVEVAWDQTHSGRQSEVGICWGLAVGLQGGTSLRIETVLMPRRTEQPSFTVTGNLGDVMHESALTAFSASRIAAPADYSQDIHLHVPDGAIPKDGPSAGLAMAAAIASAALGKRLRSDIAVTGEVTLTGAVMAVGGLREKILAAKRDNFLKVVVPVANKGDLLKIADEVTEGIEIIWVDSVKATLAVLFEQAG